MSLSATEGSGDEFLSVASDADLLLRGFDFTGLDAQGRLESSERESGCANGIGLDFVVAEHGSEGTYESTIRNVEILIASRPNGLVLQFMKTEYFRMYGHPLKCNSVDDIIDLLLVGSSHQCINKKQVTDRLQPRRYDEPAVELVASDGNYVMIKPLKPLIIKARTEMEKSNFLPELSVLRKLPPHLPEYVMGPKDDLTVQTITGSAGDFVELRVSETKDPFSFFVQFRPITNKLELLMTELGQFYLDHREDKNLCIPRIFGQLVGMIVAAVFCDGANIFGWHRAKVLHPKAFGAVYVFYVDYGTTREIPMSYIRFLPKKFAELPAQAIKVELGGILPPDADVGDVEFNWPMCSSLRFHKLVFATNSTGLYGGIYGQILKREPMSGKMQLCLYDTITNNAPSGININKCLIDEGLAIKDPLFFGTADYSWNYDQEWSPIELVDSERTKDLSPSLLKTGSCISEIEEERVVEVSQEKLMCSTIKVSSWMLANEKVQTPLPQKIR